MKNLSTIEEVRELVNANKGIKVYNGLYLSPSFEDGDYYYYPLANGSVWCESKHRAIGFSATEASYKASSVRNKTLDRWFNLAD